MEAAVPTEYNHFFGVSLQGAYATSYPYQSQLKRLPGGTAGVHMLYEYQNGNFMMNIGAGFSWERTGWSVSDYILLPDQAMKDSQGEDMILRTFAKRQDVIRRGVVDIPLLFGGEWGMGYFLAGVKAGIGVIDQSELQARITTEGIYDRYFVPIHDASNHAFYTDQPVHTSYTMPVRWDVRASVEGGLSIAQAVTSDNVLVKVRLGAFVDYGWFITRQEVNTVFISHSGSRLDLSTFNLHPIVTTGTHMLDHLLAGVKFTLLMSPLHDIRDCPSCRLLDDRWHPSRAKKRCVMCGYY